MTTFAAVTTGMPRVGRALTPVAAMVVLLVHVPLGLAMRAYPGVSTIHALVVLAVGLVWALGGSEDRVAVWSAYVTGSEVLWRMTDSSTSWDFAKYALALIFGLAILRSMRLVSPAPALIYLALLIPSSLLVVSNLGSRLALNAMTFNLMGPVALAMGVLFYSRLTLSPGYYVATLLAVVGPIISVGSVVLLRLFFGAPVVFTSSSNFAASGGFPPNQVSSLLGLGALFSLLLFLTARGPGWLRAILLSLVVGLACQSALTFSRGGLYTAIGAAAAAMPFIVRDRAGRRRLLLGGTIALAFTLLLVIPALQSFTEGALGARFEDRRTTGRDVIAMADLAIWKENPILGVGPGMGPASRLMLLGAAPAAHTEWTRLVAEHGLLGFGAALCLVAIARRAFLTERRPLEKAFSAALVAWAFLYMCHAGMRLVAPAFAIGLAQCRIGGGANPDAKERGPMARRVEKMRSERR